MKNDRRERRGHIPDAAGDQAVEDTVAAYLAIPRARIFADVAAWANSRARRKAIRFRTSGEVVAWASFELACGIDRVCLEFHARVTTTDVVCPDTGETITGVSTRVRARTLDATCDPWTLQRVRGSDVQTMFVVRIPKTVIDWVARGDQDSFAKYLWRKESHLRTLPLLIKRNIVHCGLWGEPDTGDPPRFPEDDQDQSNRTR